VSFVHLHNHTEYSLLDGAIKLERLPRAAAEMEMPAVAITDHGNLFGAIKFYQAAERAGVKPIIGSEVYIAPESRLKKSKDLTVPEASFHLTLLAKDLDGYHNLIKLVSIGYLEGFYYRPRIDREVLAQHSKGLIGLSGCMKGEIPYWILKGDVERARNALGSYLEILGKDNFYLELMRLGLDGEEYLIDQLVQLAREFDCPIVATNDCHYLTAKDTFAHEVLLCIQTKKRIRDRDRLRFKTNQVYFKSPKEMAQLFEDLPEAISNTLIIAERCNVLFNLGTHFNLPRYPRPDGFASDFDYLSHLAHHGLREKLPGFSPEVLKRLEYELEVIKRRGLSGYFLIVKDLVDFARSRGIPVGPGRGSAVGSLVLYVLGITDINPLDYGLIFERFLNPERKGMPDIDIDFSDVRREEVIRYIIERYGEKNTTQVITFGTMQARAVIRDVGRVLGLSYGEVDRIAKLIPHNQSINQALSLSSELRRVIGEKGEYEILIKTAEKLEGLVRHASTHAAGVVITPTDLTDYVPLYRSPDSKEISTQYEKSSLEAVGILKMDILGLRTLTVIDETLKAVGITKESIPLDDKPTFDLLKRGETVGVFQLESEGMKGILRKFQPESLKELIAVVALYRPGPLGNVNLEQMIRNKKNPDQIRYLHPGLKPILAETYGMIIYQEQVMEIAHQIGGFSMAQADQLRRAMSKKVIDLMEKLKDDFKAGAKRNGIRPKLAEEIFEYLAPFAGYGFNKSHATAYALIAYQTAYLKAHYPVEFMLANLNSELNDTDRLSVLCRELDRLKIKILPPDINQSGPRFQKENNAIRYALAGLKNVGLSAAEAIVAERKKGRFKSIFDFLLRVKGINRKVVESLIKAGAFDSIGDSRARMLDIALNRNAHHGLQTSLFQKEEVKEWSKLERINYEKEAFGFYFSTHPLECYRLEYEALNLTPLDRIKMLGDGSEIRVGGIITKREIKRDRKGGEFARIRIEDLTGSIEILLFSDLLKRVRDKLSLETMVVVRGRFAGGEKPVVRGYELLTLDEAKQMIQGLVIRLGEETGDEELEMLRKILSRFPGDRDVYFLIGNRAKVRSKRLKVALALDLHNELTRILGRQGVSYFINKGGR